MTVASLWKALDRAGCGKPVGSEEMRDHRECKKVTNPWNYNDMSKASPPTLAIDLSIWICESLTSPAMAENHADPTLHLVYSRTIKLLTVGIKLIGVIEGKRRLQVEGDKNEFQKRRGGTPFWRACERCEKLLELLGVPVVRAKAEGEALCALLNEQGIVDGVISNDGDCFLFGAKVMYTKFSIENLNQGSVMRYDSENLVAFLDDDDNDEFDIKAQEHSDSPTDVVALSRSDLVAFAILTGSDVAGGGLSKVGCRKALRFIRKCQIDNPLRATTAAFDEMISWAKAGKVDFSSIPRHDSDKNCSSCCHPGTKSRHLKNGCDICGTCPGEPCFQVSPGGKFRQSLRARALAMESKFDPESIANVYRNPNDKQIPSVFVGLNSQKVLMRTPDLHGFLQSSLIVRGRNSLESRTYVLQSLSRLLAKSELSNFYKSTPSTECSDLRTSNKNKPFPVRIKKSVTRSSIPCFQVLWKVNATTTDSHGNPIDEFEFMTVEDQGMVRKCFPELVEKFSTQIKEQAKQGYAEQERRKAFLEVMVNQSHQGQRVMVNKESTKLCKGRRGFFPKRDLTLHNMENLCLEHNVGKVEARQPKPHISRCHKMGDDAAMLFQVSASHLRTNRPSRSENDSVETISTLSEDTFQVIEHPTSNSWSLPMNENSPYKTTLTPSHLHFLGTSSHIMMLDDRNQDSSRHLSDLNIRDHCDSSGKSHSYCSEYSIAYQRSFEFNDPSLQPKSSKCDIFDRSPLFKRSKFSRGCASPPRVSDDCGLTSDRALTMSGFQGQSEKDRDGDFLFDDECQGKPPSAPTCDGKYVWEMSSSPSGFVGHDQKDAFSPRNVSYKGRCRRKDDRRSTGINIDMANSIEKMLASSEIEDSWLVESFAGVSIHSLHSPMAKAARAYTDSHPPERRDGPDETKATTSTEQWLGFRAVDQTARRHGTLLNNEMVETAIAKWEHRSLLARTEEENQVFLRDELWYDRFD